MGRLWGHLYMSPEQCVKVLARLWGAIGCVLPWGHVLSAAGRAAAVLHKQHRPAHRRAPLCAAAAAARSL